MAYTASYVASQIIRDALINAVTNFKPTADTMKIGLFNNSFAGGCQTDDPARYNSGSYTVTNEVTSTAGGTWNTGGVALTAPTLTMVSNAGVTGTASVATGIGVNFTAGNVSVTPTTLTNAFGAIIYDSTLSDYILVNISFGGGFSTTAGTFAITWGTANTVASIFYIQLH